MTSSSLHTQGVVSDYFTLETHLLSTRSADAYRAIDRSRQSSVTLWILRHPLAIESDSVRRFLSRLQAIKTITPSVGDLLSFGVDSSGIAFAVYGSFDGMAITGNIREVTEAERRFFSSLRLIERLHQQDVVCGDLCSGSFWLDRNGELRFVGVIGSFDGEAKETSMLPPADTLQYVAPEQLSGGGITAATDVFALGVLGYHLLTGRFPFPASAGGFIDSSAAMIPISTVLAGPPVWAEEVISRCLCADPAERYASAGEVFQDVLAARDRSTQRASMPVRTSKDGQRTKGESALPTTHRSGVLNEEEFRPAPAPKADRKKKLMIGATVALVGLAAVMIVGGGDVGHAPDGTPAHPVHQNVDVNQQVQQAIAGLGGSADAVTENDRQIEALVKSDDPIAHDTLVRLAIESKTAQSRHRAEKGIIDRARRLGLVRSAEEIRAWLQSIPGTAQLPASYDPLLRSLDVTAPLEGRQRYLRQAYVTSPAAVLRFTAGLGFDTKKLDEFQPLLAQLVGDNLRLDDADKHSAYALVLADPVLSPIYADDVIQNLSLLPDADVPWLLEILAARKDVNIKPIANVAIDRNLLSPIRRIFAQLLRDRDNLSPAVSLALVNAVAGATGVSDVGRFGEWYDMDSERVLFAIMADSSDPVILVEAFDTVAGKSLSIQPSANLVDRVRQKTWARRVDVANGIGVLSSPDSFTPEQLDQALSQFDTYVRTDPQYLDIFFNSPNLEIVKAVVKRWAPDLGPGRLIQLLGNPEKSTRLLAIDRLKEYNHAQLLKVIIEYYDREKDPEVIAAYKSAFWFIKERDKTF